MTAYPAAVKYKSKYMSEFVTLIIFYYNKMDDNCH